MSLKDLISSLIEAVFGSKKAFISNQAMPNVASHITLANNVGNETEFVAPSNGYVCLQGQSNAVNNELSLVSNELRSSSWGVNGWGVRQQHYGVIQQSEAGQASRLSLCEGGAL